MSAMRSTGDESSPQSFRRKSVMFDLDDEEKGAMLEEEKDAEAELETLDPMPIEEGEESVAWSKIDGDFDQEEDYDEQQEDDGYASRSDESEA